MDLSGRLSNIPKKSVPVFRITQVIVGNNRKIHQSLALGVKSALQAVDLDGCQLAKEGQNDV